MVLYKLNTSCEVCLVKLIGNIPAQWAKLPPLLHSSVEEGYGIQHWPPLGQVGVVELLLRDTGICPLEASLHTLWWLISELDAGLRPWHVI